MESSSSLGSTVPTTVRYNHRKYRGFDFTDAKTKTLDDVRVCIAAAVEHLPPSLSYTIEIDDGDDDYVVLTSHYLRNKRPWKPNNSEQQSLPPDKKKKEKKKVDLKVVPNIEPQPNVRPVLPLYVTANDGHSGASVTDEDQQQSTAGFKDVAHTDSEKTATATTNANDSLDFANMTDGNIELFIDNYFPLPINKLQALAFLSQVPLNFVSGVRKRQRLQYPDEKNFVMIQMNKEEKYKYKSMRPVLQIPPAYENFIRAGGSVDLVSAVVVKVFNNDQSSYFCLAPYRGFWPLDTDNRPSKKEETSFSNPFIWRIKKEQLQVVQTAEGIRSCQLTLRLCLMHQDGKLNDRTPQLVRFDENFVLSAARPVPSHINYVPGPAVTITNERETYNENECYLVCMVRSDTTSDLLDRNSYCPSTMFTVDLRPYSK